MHAAATSIAEEDRLRAELYQFIGGLLLRAPDQAALDQIAGLEGDDSPLGRAFADLAKQAASHSPDQANAEYQTLFIGLGRGVLVPYASYYLTGFLNEKPLAKLRQRLGALGIERRDAVKEPEDHMGTLCEVMAGLITGTYGASADITVQKELFNAHIAPWARHFFADLASADEARFYKPLGEIGTAFMGIEAQAFEMD